MYTRVVRSRNKDGSIRQYLQLVEGYRKDGKVHQRLIYSIGRLDILRANGSLDRLISSLARHSEQCWLEAEGEGRLPWVKTYGPVLIFHRIWEELGLSKVILRLQAGTEVRFPVEEAAFVMVLHRLLDPGSKKATYEWLETVYRPQFDSLELCHLYRTLDYLVEGKEILEEALFARNRDLFSLTVDLILFDTTLVHFEGKGPRGLATLSRPGNYPDCVKVLMGLVMTGDGFPIAHHVFPGNTADIIAFRSALDDLRRRFSLRRVVIVADRGVVSRELTQELEKEGVEYIFGVRMRKDKEVAREVLSYPGRYHEVEKNLRVKEVCVGEHRFIVCHNPEEEERDRKNREEIVEHIREEISNKGPQAFVMPRGLRRFVKLVGGEVVLKEKAIEDEARYDGKWVLKTNTNLSAPEVALAYKSLWQVEHAFRELKSGLEIRPVYVRTENHVRGHIVVCFLALVLEAALQRLLNKQGTTASYREVLCDIEQLKALCFEARGKKWLWRNELPGKAYDAFHAIGMRPPPRVQPLA
jgi:transposase